MWEFYDAHLKNVLHLQPNIPIPILFLFSVPKCSYIFKVFNFFPMFYVLNANAFWIFLCMFVFSFSFLQQILKI